MMYARLPRRVSSYNEPAQLAIVCSGCQQLAAQSSQPFSFPATSAAPFPSDREGCEMSSRGCPLADLNVVRRALSELYSCCFCRSCCISVLSIVFVAVLLPAAACSRPNTTVHTYRVASLSAQPIYHLNIIDSQHEHDGFSLP